MAGSDEKPKGTRPKNGAVIYRRPKSESYEPLIAARDDPFLEITQDDGEERCQDYFDPHRLYKLRRAVLFALLNGGIIIFLSIALISLGVQSPNFLDTRETDAQMSGFSATATAKRTDKADRPE